jgi:hypothetical protein
MATIRISMTVETSKTKERIPGAQAVEIASGASIPEVAVRASSHRFRRSFAEVTRFWSR